MLKNRLYTSAFSNMLVELIVDDTYESVLLRIIIYFLLNRTNGVSYTGLLSLSIQPLIHYFTVGPFSTATAVVFVRYSTFTGRARRCVGFYYWRNTTDCYSCSWFCTILLEFSSMFLCKISFSSSSNACLPFPVL